MNQVSVITIFCEDVRQEKTGSEILIGVMPANVNLTKIPGNFAKLAIYTRIAFLVEFNPGPIEIVISTPWDGEKTLTILDEAFVSKAISDANASNGPLVGLISRAVSAPFSVPAAGQVKIYAKFGDRKILGGSLNLSLAPAGV